MGFFALKVEECKRLKSAGKNASDNDTNEVDDEKKAHTAEILETGRLFVRNLPYVCGEEELRAHFEHFGALAEIQCIIDRTSGRSKGYALITYVFPEHALTAYNALDGTIFKVLEGRNYSHNFFAKYND